MFVKDLPWNTYIISETDLKGRIIYANKTFSEICEYDVDGLIGCNHNIVRSVDMPSWVFEDLWLNIEQDKIWTGIVKNQTFDGLKVYWVRATIFPLYNLDHKKVGYRSERTPATDLEIAQAMDQYDVEFD